MGIIDAIQGKRVYLETNIFIYALEAFPEYVETLTSLFRAFDEGRLTAVTSELTLAELLIKPLVDNNDHLQQVYQDTIQSSDNLDVIPISREVLINAAKIRAQSTTIHLPDAIHLASARIWNCSSFITNDKRLKGFSNNDMIIISDIH